VLLPGSNLGGKSSWVQNVVVQAHIIIPVDLTKSSEGPILVVSGSLLASRWSERRAISAV